MRYAFAVSMLLAIGASAQPWGKPFDGKTLKGWKTEGKAAWTVEAGAIVGRPGANGAPGDIFTEAQWRDFDLEVEWKMRFPGNSGIWFRYTGPQSAYQADILDEPSYPDAKSGSLYCMGKAFIAKNSDAATVKKDGWNKMRVRAKGDELVIWSNGREVVRVRDATFRGPGRIGIQVHAGKEFEGMEIRVRNMRIRSGDAK